MPHIHNHPSDHDATASAFIVRLDTPQPTLMLHKHKKLGVWLQFGGHVETNENPWQTIVHELKEESGYEVDQLKVLQPKPRLKSMTGVIMHPIPLAPMTHKFPNLEHYHSDWGFGFTTDQEPKNIPDDGESKIIKCFTLGQLKNLADNEIPPNVREVGIFIFTEALKHWDQVAATSWSTEAPPEY